MKFDGFALRIGIGLLVASQSMIFGLAINLEDDTPRSVKISVQGVILAGTLLVLALLGPPLFRNAFAELRRRRLTIESLFLLTMAGAMFASMQSLITGRGSIYFEVVTVLLVVYSLGKAIGARSRNAALTTTRQWAGSLARCRLADQRQVDVIEIKAGDLVEVHPGEAIAVDGVIRQGTGFVSEAMVSGEPFAVVRRPGDRVLAGMIAHDAVLRVEATAAGTARRIDRLLETVEAARFHPTSMQAQADRLGRLFFPLIVATAILTFAFWTWQSGWETGLFNAMSVLLVACPCALGLATPIVLWSALNRLAERGIVVHAGDVIERLASVDRVVFDKTGTLTEDQFALVDIATQAEGEERTRILGWIALVEEHSKHPIARPFAKRIQFKLAGRNGSTDWGLLRNRRFCHACLQSKSIASMSRSMAS
ncbi:MAG: HAD-IC family P-type ATPase [Planctomycetes bacterium]|nr:HAD-IC family P-type ATPase [Planctomycetota bacterium]